MYLWFTKPSNHGSSAYSDWLRAGQWKGWSLSHGRAKNFHFILSRLAQGACLTSYLMIAGGGGGALSDGKSAAFKFFCCCMCICWHGYVFTELLFSNSSLLVLLCWLSGIKGIHRDRKAIS